MTGILQEGSGCSQELGGVGMVQAVLSIGRRANSEGLAAQTGSMGKNWSLESPLWG